MSHSCWGMPGRGLSHRRLAWPTFGMTTFAVLACGEKGGRQGTKVKASPPQGPRDDLISRVGFWASQHPAGVGTSWGNLNEDCVALTPWM